jgi:hypothetical protein
MVAEAIMTTNIIATGLLLIGLSGANADAASCTARSGPATVAVVELYTSEGCNSCPPADRWLSATIAPGGAGAIALAFHVDYWNGLGWPRPFREPHVHDPPAPGCGSERRIVRLHAAGHVAGARFSRLAQRRRRPRRSPQRLRGPPRATLALEARVAGGSVQFDATADVPGRAIVPAPRCMSRSPTADMCPTSRPARTRACA